MSGIIIIDKPEGITSFKTVSIVRSCLKIKKVGHMGTLDPMATGVLPIMLGRATKALDLLRNCSKKYIFRIKFGISTDTQDITGKVVHTSNIKARYSTLKNVIDGFKGEIFQIPPMYSAIKKNGVRLYELAREGREIEREKRKIFIDHIKILEFDEKNQEATVFVSCSGGTYVRTICDDIGNKIGAGAVMKMLRRVESNGFDINESIGLEKFKLICENNEIYKYIIPIERLFKKLPVVQVTHLQAKRFKNGGGLSAERVNCPVNVNGGRFCVYCENKFIGLGEINSNKNELSVLKIFDVD